MKTAGQVDKTKLRAVIVSLNEVEGLIPEKIRLVGVKHDELLLRFVEEVKAIPLAKDEDIPQDVIDLYNEVMAEGDEEVAKIEEEPAPKKEEPVVPKKEKVVKVKGFSMTGFIDSLFVAGGTLDDILAKVVAKESEVGTLTYGKKGYLKGHMKFRQTQGWEYSENEEGVITGVKS